MENQGTKNSLKHHKITQELEKFIIIHSFYQAAKQRQSSSENLSIEEGLKPH